MAKKTKTEMLMIEEDYGTQWQQRSRDFNKYSEDPFMALDLYRMILGDKISFGVFRNVYDYTPGTVIKVAYVDWSVNVQEYRIWEAVKRDPAKRKWFAPVVAMSPNGHFLVQKKVRMITDNDKLPRTLPRFFEDVKKDNFGFIGDQFVCFDYHFIGMALKDSLKKMDKVKW